MEQPTVLFCTGLSGTGKSYFIKNILPKGAFYNLRSATTRPMRKGEVEGQEYFFRDEKYFETETFATKLFVNEQFWKPGDPKWLYGVPEIEITSNWTKNFTYDVIQPRYVRQMIDWFIYVQKHYKMNPVYNFQVAWFIPDTDNFKTAAERQNMPNDLEVRRANTCNLKDFENAGLHIDHFVISNPKKLFIDKPLRILIDSVAQHTK